ncbi:CHAT domain-containing protein [Rhizoctonia solani]|nr:CHAT domain-containing protein [Rhizoctonia solani]
MDPSRLPGPVNKLHDAKENESDSISSLYSQTANGVPGGDDHTGILDVASLIPESPNFDELQDLNEAIDSYRQALSLISDTDQDYLHVLHLLSGAYATRFQILRELGDIDAATACGDQTVALGSASDNGVPLFLGNLGTFYMLRYDQFGDPDNVKRAIENLSLAVALTPPNDSELPLRLDMLGLSHIRRFECLGNPDDIETAVDHHTRAITLTSNDNPEMPKQLCNLGIALRTRFEHSGILQDIDRAIELMSRASIRMGNSPFDISLTLKSLGIAHMCRFHRLHNVSDVDRAIEYQSSVISLIPDHEITPEYFSALGNSHSARFQHLGQPVNSSSAIECHAQAMSLTPDGHPEMPARLTNLGISHALSFEHFGKLEDLNTAIECHSLAVALSSDKSSDFPSRLSNLGTSHALRFQHTGDLEDLHMGIEYLARSISLLAQDSPDVSAKLNSLGALYINRFLRLADLDSLKSASASWEKSSQLLSGYPIDRFQASLRWAETVSPSSPDQLRAYAQAMNLIPRVVWLGVSVGRRYEDVPLLENVAIEAAAAATHAQNYHLALEWLEQGRSVVWNQILQLRTSFEMLSQVDSNLADKLLEVAKKLDTAGTLVPSSSSSSISLDLFSQEYASAGHRRLAEQYDDLISQARLIPGFEYFLRPKKAQQLIRAAHSGPVVVLNNYSSRCDVLIILPNSEEIKHISLPDFSEEKAKTIRSNIDASLWHQGVRTSPAPRGFSKGRGKKEHNAHESLERSLSTLWVSVVKPVLEFLGYERQEKVEALPHITWCATGVLSSLPLHASGDYGRSDDRLSNFAISSYTPTLGALLSASPTSETHSRILAIGQEHTPGHSPLPATVTELAHIRKRAAEGAVRCSQLDGSRATRSAVLDTMEGYDWIHLACHAHQNLKDPTQSGFFLHDGVLSLAEITQKSFKNKGLAFLSACQTAKGDKELADESVHLASGMLIAGYPSVIATMWSIMDVDAPAMAEEVYGQLIKDGRMDHRDIAKALHIATSALRTRIGEKEFARWVPYIHIGR